MRSTKPHRVFGRLLLGIVVLTAGAASCSRGERVLGDSLSADGDDDTPTFVAPPDAEAPEAAVELTAYCPSNKCPAGRTTCPSSPFLCDVDLLTDRNNCGACGAVCPSETSREYYECVEGRCMLQCKSQPVSLDCDGVPDNGCETTPTNNEHCGACGNKCADQAKPCVQRSPIVGDVGCGCKGDDLLCTTPTLRCVKARSDDSNCGACGRVCDPNGDGGVQYANTYYGCFDGQCGALKCRPNFGNCDGDKLNGCEADFLSAEHCGGCGNACGAGQECRLDLSGTPQCMCPAGKTFCATQCVGNVCKGECADLATDRKNCGACGIPCRSSVGPNSVGICSYGMCNLECIKGWADCNGNEADGCEVNANSDPANCGACGRVCDAIAGQACVGGECVVEPCATEGRDAGEVAR